MLPKVALNTIANTPNSSQGEYISITDYHLKFDNCKAKKNLVRYDTCGNIKEPYGSFLYENYYY